jgi:hypothetical protein
MIVLSYQNESCVMPRIWGFCAPEPPVFRAIPQPANGWLELTRQAIQRLRMQSFTLDDLEAEVAPIAAGQYPHNKHVRAKLRQQLQTLRDMGVVEFLGSGSYKVR